MAVPSAEDAIIEKQLGQAEEHPGANAQRYHVCSKGVRRVRFSLRFSLVNIASCSLLYSHATPSTLEDQRRLIEDLARSNQEYTRKFKELTKAVEAGQNHLEAVKPISTTENMPSSGFLQANMVLPAFESFHTAGEASPDITSRLTTLTKQHLPPDAEPQSDELSHYCLLINHLLQRIDAVQYKIKSDLRRRIRSDVVHMHQREADQLADAHGHRQFTTVMGSATKWAETLHPTEFGASQTLRNLLHPDWSEQDWNSFDALLEHGDGLQDHASSIREQAANLNLSRGSSRLSAYFYFSNGSSGKAESTCGKG